MPVRAIAAFERDDTQRTVGKPVAARYLRVIQLRLVDMFADIDRCLVAKLVDGQCIAFACCFFYGFGKADCENTAAEATERFFVVTGCRHRYEIRLVFGREFPVENELIALRHSGIREGFLEYGFVAETEIVQHDGSCHRA